MEKMKNQSLTVAFLGLAIISGCTSTGEIARSMYNVREAGVSQFDGTKFVRMKNIACPGDRAQDIRLDLYQDSRMAQTSTALLKVKVTGAHSIDSGKSLHFNIDGEFLDLATTDTTTEMEEVYPAQSTPGYAGGGTYVAPAYFPGLRASTKRYSVSQQTIEKIGRAKRVVVRVDLSSTFVEGVCSPSETGSTKDNELLRELSGTEGFKGFAEMTKTMR
jgi:hypothetical protein